jgi:hypothetical protein
MTPTPTRFIGTLLLVALVCNTTAFACGPFALEAIFVHTVHPGYPLESFARGEIGVVQPTYARSYLYVAYRYLNGTSFTESEQKTLVEFWKDRLEYRWSLNEDEWVKAWSTAREKVPGLSEAPKINVYRSRDKPNEYETFLNCQKDAFDTAISTLNDRLAKYGADSPVLREWVTAQDQVFSNCSQGSSIPPVQTTTSDQLAVADRKYQVAAAQFYAGSFDEARAGFEAIERDQNSPWKVNAAYLVARTLIRKASLGPDDAKAKELTQAESQLTKILKNQSQNQVHAAANRLMDLVKVRLHPAARLHELAHSLLLQDRDNRFQQNLWDYTALLDQFLETEDAAKLASVTEIMQADDLSDWIANLQSGGDTAKAHALTRWQATHSEAWLIAALAKADGKTGNNDSLVAAAQAVPASSKAFASARFHAIRLLDESGKTTEARRLVDQALKDHGDVLDQSAKNLLIGQRFSMATSLSDFLSNAPRMPAALSWNDDGREVPSDAAPEETKTIAGKPFFDEDAAQIINRRLPLSVLQEAATTSQLPENLRRDVTQAAFIRAVVLDDLKTAAAVAPTLKDLVPAISSLVVDFEQETSPEAKKFAAIYLWLKTPGMEPVVDEGIGRETPLNERDTYRDNWWCSATFSNVPSADETTGESKPFTSRAVSSPRFLSPQLLASGTKQFQQISAIGRAPNYLCQQVINWATQNPADPRVAEALHLAVTTTRHGCTDANSGRWSKAAFDLLHRKYGNTSWAKKTPYWFKD